MAKTIKTKKPSYERELQRYIKNNPGRTTSRLLKLARSRKPTGRLNIDDVMNAKDSGVLAGTGFGKKTQSKGPAGKVKGPIGKVIGGKRDSLRRTKAMGSELARVMPKLGLTAAQQLKLKKQMKRAGGMKSSDALKAAAAKIKSQKTQSKGPVGTRLKKRSILGK
jgi:hypothetical protein